MSDPSKVYDLTPDQREIAEWRAKRRLFLRNEYLKQIHSPNLTEGYVFDPQIQRHYTMNFSMEKIFKPTVVNWFCSMALTLGGGLLIAWRVKAFRDKRENKFRTGQVSYRDREWKFV